MKLKMLGMVLSVLLLIPVGLLASGRNSKGIDINKVVKVGSTSLKPGHYKVMWSGSGNKVQVIFLHDNKTVAAAPAHLVWRNNPYDDAIETNTAPDNSQVVQELDWKNLSLVFEATDSSAGN